MAFPTTRAEVRQRRGEHPHLHPLTQALTPNTIGGCVCSPKPSTVSRDGFCSETLTFQHGFETFGELRKDVGTGSSHLSADGEEDGCSRAVGNRALAGLQRHCSHLGFEGHLFSREPGVLSPRPVAPAKRTGSGDHGPRRLHILVYFSLFLWSTAFRQRLPIKFIVGAKCQYLCTPRLGCL